MKPNYGMIPLDNSVNSLPHNPELTAVSYEKTVALTQWLQSIDSLALPETRQRSHYSVDRSPLELRLYALFAD